MDTVVLERSVSHKTWQKTHAVAPKKKKSFKEACIECNAVSVDAFFDELNARIDKWQDNA
jgi:hypothetical protein